MDTDAKTVLTHTTLRALLAANDHPWELIVSRDDFRLIRKLVGGGPPWYDDRGPFVWYDTTRIRPAISETAVDLSRLDRFVEDGLAKGWRG